MSDFQIELSILCQYFWSIKPINEPILPKMDDISAQRFSREVPGNIKPLTKLTDKWTLNFETWRLKKSFVIKTTTNFFFFTFSNFIQAYRQLYYYARKKLTAVTCAYLGNQPSPMRNLPKPLLHYKNSSLFLYPQRKSIWCNKLSKYGRSDFVVFRELASLLKNNLCDFFSAFCRWEYLFNRKVNVCFFQDEIVSFCPQKIECLHFQNRKKFESMQQAY